LFQREAERERGNEARIKIVLIRVYITTVFAPSNEFTNLFVNGNLRELATNVDK